MNSVFTLVPATRTLTSLAPEHYSDYMLSELLAMHEELIVRLREESLEAADGTAALLTCMIAQHEKDAMQLRALLVDPAADIA